ncbi:hypothetical protein BJV78DRAFT_248746 [Lactifluus subvellereus]|nr:hypothetical protein BJV78DRAFT_248746 [Lactifluus subvellereus]
MPRRKKNRSSSAHRQPLASASSTSSQTPAPAPLLNNLPEESSSFGGIPVVEWGMIRPVMYTSIVCRPEHCHLSTEEMRWRYYLDCGRATSFPKFDAPTPTSTFSIAPKTSDSSAPAPATVDVESATSICSLCAARLALSDRGCGGNDIFTERVAREYNGVESDRATDRDNTRENRPLSWQPPSHRCCAAIVLVHSDTECLAPRFPQGVEQEQGSSTYTSA